MTFPHIHIFLLLSPAIFYINHLWIIGLWRACYYCEFNQEENMLLWRLHKWAKNNLGIWAKPFIICPPCMASLHSTYFYWAAALLIGFESWMLPLYLVYAVCLVGYNWKAL